MAPPEVGFCTPAFGHVERDLGLCRSSRFFWISGIGPASQKGESFTIVGRDLRMRYRPARKGDMVPLLEIDVIERHAAPATIRELPPIPWQRADDC
jgi:hypothetical protein